MLYWFNIWVRGVARLTRPPVTGKIVGSNPIGPAGEKKPVRVAQSVRA